MAGWRHWVTVLFAVGSAGVMATEPHSRWEEPEVWLVVFTFALCVFTALLWWATRKLVQGADATAQRQLRAYVHPEAGNELNVARYPNIETTFEIEVRIKNYGQTPAHNLKGLTWVALEPWPLRADFQFEGPDGPRNNGMALPPGGVVSFHTGSARPFDADELEALRSGALRLLIYGHVIYDDAFGTLRRTNFCYVSSTEAAKGFTWATGRAHLHNDAT